MSYFKAKMHSVRFRLGLHPKPRWRSLQRFPYPLAGFKGATSTSKEKEGKGKEGEGGIWGKEGGEGKLGSPPHYCRLKICTVHTDGCIVRPSWICRPVSISPDLIFILVTVTSVACFCVT